MYKRCKWAQICSNPSHIDSGVKQVVSAFNFGSLTPLLTSSTASHTTAASARTRGKPMATTQVQGKLEEETVISRSLSYFWATVQELNANNDLRPMFQKEQCMWSLKNAVTWQFHLEHYIIELSCAILISLGRRCPFFWLQTASTWYQNKGAAVSCQVAAACSGLTLLITAVFVHVLVLLRPTIHIHSQLWSICKHRNIACNSCKHMQAVFLRWACCRPMHPGGASKYTWWYEDRGIFFIQLAT